MEVFCEPPVFVKAQKNNHIGDKLYLTNINQVLNNYRSSVLFYGAEGLTEAADDPARVVRRGVEEMVAYYPWAAGHIRMAAAAHDIGAHHLEVCFHEDGGPGIQFASAHANCVLAHLGDLAEPNPAFEPLFASVDVNAPLHSRPLVALQVTRFEDGGVCVSMSSQHALFDGVAAAIFLRNIFSCARGKGPCIPVDKASREERIKPAMNRIMPLQGGGAGSSWPAYLQELFTKEWSAEQQSIYMQPTAATTRFNFSTEKLAHLRGEALSKQQDCGTGFQACSRFQALAAHLWKAKAKSLLTCSKLGPSQPFPLRMLVNVREGIVASIPRNYMGNALTWATASATVEELTEKSLAFAVEKIQEAMKQANAERFQTGVDYIQMLGRSARLIPAPCMAIASMVGLGFYEADFGWGKPAYFGHPHKQRRNLVVITEGNYAPCTSWNVLAVFDSQVEGHEFQDALNL